MAKVAMLLDHEFEDTEFRIPLDRLRAAGHEVTLLGREAGITVHGKRGEQHAAIDAPAADTDPNDYRAVVIPGGHAPDTLRTDQGVVDFVRRFCASGGPVAAVGHGPQLLIEADAVKQHKVTSWPSVRTDLENAGALWIDAEVVEDPPFITSREPADLDAFTSALLEKLGAPSARS